MSGQRFNKLIAGGDCDLMAMASIPDNNPILDLTPDPIKRSRDRFVLSGGYLEMTGIQQLHFVLVLNLPINTCKRSANSYGIVCTNAELVSRCTCDPNGGGKKAAFANPD
jgi:hypothetical protein